MPKAKVLLQLTGWRLLEQNCLVVVEVVKGRQAPVEAGDELCPSYSLTSLL